MTWTCHLRIPPRCAINTKQTILPFPPHLASSVRSASSFVPGTTQPEQIPPLPKPPSTNWFTTHPELSDSIDSFDSLIHRTRQNLHQSGILSRYSAPPDFSGTGIRLKWLKWKMMNDENHDTPAASASSTQLFNILWNKQAKWHQLPTASSLLQPREARQLRMIEYDNLIRKLNELKNLKKYLMILRTLEFTNNSEINQLDSEIEQVLVKFSKPESASNKTKNQTIERDHLGRFAGLGRKKESTAKVWMIEPKLPESISKITINPENSTSTTTISSSSENNLTSTVADPPSVSADSQSASDHQLQSDPNLDLPLGKININGQSIVDYFHDPRQRAMAIRPLEITNSVGHYNIHVLTHGGGKMGQAAAIAHAIANALMKALQEASKTADGTAKERYARKVLAKSMLTLRDPRVVERKKTGKPGAKSSYRWVKR